MENINFGAMYIIKVKGIAKIPDYVQLRDDEFTLLAYFRVDRPDKTLDKIGLSSKKEYIVTLIESLPFGKIMKLEL
ncbi:fructose-6-phosphate aldolase [Arcticibacter svalbardensis MN12-7]|uniref:Fructose-6-phosphate aldolase n=2 Tax=Sphingobacteriaceae TaxID=84566 RepID=R9GQ05_9SPHI|nr:fructose-6-phosphate aldolase [Arcticibacter svalbardensis MN12-7]